MGSAQASGSARANEAITKALDSPLLNDNKIKGAKNVLLLIVSGAEEITIDEIGEINDYIQLEAGHSANIIMGVGEDESLGDAVAVTVIATGFHVDQQDDIVNTESKKIIHTLEDEQKAEQQLSERITAVAAGVPLTPKEEPVIKHTLTEEPLKPESDLIPTTNYIKNFNVFYEEVVVESPQVVEKVDVEMVDDFIIIPSKDVFNIEVVDEEVVTAEKIEEEQFALSFDMPLNTVEEETNQNTIVFDLTDDVKNMEVKDAEEVQPVIAYETETSTRYNLDDYMELEKKLTGAESMVKQEETAVIEEEITLKTTEATEASLGDENQNSGKTDPMNSPISEMLKERADARRRTMKDFNYKFKSNNPNSIDDIEKEPAYKRQGVDLSEGSREQKISRTSLSADSNDEIQIRTNNCFYTET